MKQIFFSKDMMAFLERKYLVRSLFVAVIVYTFFLWLRSIDNIQLN